MEKSCTRCNTHFVISPDNQSFYTKMHVPLPTVCPDCRFMMRAMWRNETTLYSRICDLCHKNIVSIYNPKSPYTIYCTDCFTSDKWDAREFARPYDLSRSFFEQVNELFIAVPKHGLAISAGDGPNVRSEYVNMASGVKDCYLVFNTSPAEELLYSRGVRNGNFSSDIYFGVDFERCYECINVQKSSGVFYGKNIVSCIDSYFLLNCSNLINCFGCVNLRNKSHCWFNEQLSPEEYAERLEEVLGSYEKTQEAKKTFYDFTKKFPMRENNNFKTVDSTGDFLSECKNCVHAFEANGAEDSSYIAFSKGIKDSIGTIGYGTNASYLLECVATGYSSNVIGSFWAENSQNVWYTFDVRNCHDCIGCDALKNGKYSVLNHEYTKEKYDKIKEQIIRELTDLDIHGLMMPPEVSPFGYNETVGNDNMPLSREEALKRGLKWQDDVQKTVGKETLSPENIPDHIDMVEDTITEEILACIDCARNYKIREQEFSFYQRMKLPIPRKCFFCRHQDRIVQRGPYQFWDRVCDHCNKKITTNYAPDRSEIVYCESCYKQEVL
jgi:hypothetical protein